MHPAARMRQNPSQGSLPMQVQAKEGRMGALKHALGVGEA